MMLTVLPNGPGSMARSLVQWFLYTVVVSFFARLRRQPRITPGTDYLRVFQLVGATAFRGLLARLAANVDLVSARVEPDVQSQSSTGSSTDCSPRVRSGGCGRTRSLASCRQAQWLEPCLARNQSFILRASRFDQR